MPLDIQDLAGKALRGVPKEKINPYYKKIQEAR
jgi:hypothetical protein